MSNQPLTMSRRHVLGDLNTRCEPAENVPVYLNGTDGEMLGYVDESLGKYADAFTFHIADDLCKKLAAGHFTYSFDYDFAEGNEAASASAKRRIRLNSITLVMRKGYEKPTPRNAPAVIADPVEAA